MKLYQRFLISIPMWVVFELCTWVLVFFGLLIVPVAIMFRQVIPSPIDGRPITTAPDWLWLWGNDEEGYCSQFAKDNGPPAWVAKLITSPSFSMWWWAAIRNTVDNLRFVRWLCPPPDKNRIQFLQGAWWALTWQGWLHHLTVIKFGYEFTVGWKYYPSDKAVTNEAAYGWRRFGCGFALRLRKADAATTLAG